MLYKITFFQNQINFSAWHQFFQTIYSAANNFNFTITIQGNKIDFFIKSEYKLDILNHRLFPLFLTDEINEHESKLIQQNNSHYNFFPLICFKSLTEIIEKQNLKNLQLIKIEFSCYKYNPFKNLPKFKYYFLIDNKIVLRQGYCLIPLTHFLSFDLSHSIASEISKVKPVLKRDKLMLDLEKKGILEVKDGLQSQQFAIKSYNFQRHSLILGQSGSGKSIFIKLMIEDIYKKMGNDYAVVLIDPHAGLEALINNVKPRIKIDFKNSQTNLFINIGQANLSTELTLGLFSTVLNINENQNLLRMLKFCLKLLFTINQMNLYNLKNLLTDPLYKNQVLKQIDDPSILKFFDTEFQQLKTSQYDTAVLPILNLISELDFVKPNTPTIDLTQAIDTNFLVSFPIKQTELGSNITKIIGGAIIQQIFTIMQAGLTKKKLILIIDEFALVQTPSLIHILSESRKFGLTVICSQQYLLQVSAPLLQSIFANIVNYFCFKLSRDDGEIIARNLNFEIDEYFLKNKNDPREIHELGTKLLTDLSPRELIVRVMANDQYCSPFKAKTVNIEKM